MVYEKFCNNICPIHCDGLQCLNLAKTQIEQLFSLKKFQTLLIMDHNKYILYIHCYVLSIVSHIYVYSQSEKHQLFMCDKMLNKHVWNETDKMNMSPQLHE